MHDGTGNINEIQIASKNFDSKLMYNHKNRHVSIYILIDNANKIKLENAKDASIRVINEASYDLHHVQCEN